MPACLHRNQADNRFAQALAGLSQRFQLVEPATQDRLVDIDAQSSRLHSDVPQSKFHRVPGNGHMVHQTATHDVMSAINEVAEDTPNHRQEPEPTARPVSRVGSPTRTRYGAQIGHEREP